MAGFAIFTAAPRSAARWRPMQQCAQSTWRAASRVGSSHSGAEFANALLDHAYAESKGPWPHVTASGPQARALR